MAGVICAETTWGATTRPPQLTVKMVTAAIALQSDQKDTRFPIFLGYSKPIYVTGYVGLTYCSTIVATASWSIVEGTLQLL